MFSIERRILTAVVLTASLVAMAVGQQPAPSRASKRRPPVSATPAAAAQLSSRTLTAPPAVSATPALAPAAIASEPSTVLTPTAARISQAQATPPSASSGVRPTLAPASPADWQVLPFQTSRASTAPPAAAVTPVDTFEPPQRSTSRAPQNQARPTVAQTPAATQRSPDYVEEKGFKGRVFEIKHRDPDSLAQVLRPLGSGFKGATI